MGYCCSSADSSAEIGNAISADVTTLTQMVQQASHVEELMSYIEDRLNVLIIGIDRPQPNTFERKVVKSHRVVACIEFGRKLLEDVQRKCDNRAACKTCVLRKISFETPKVVSGVMKESDRIRWVSAGLSVVGCMPKRIMEAPTNNRREYVQLVLYMFGLLKHIKPQLDNPDLPQKKLNDVVHFIVQVSVLCIFQMQSKNLCRSWFYPSSIDAGDIQNHMFELGCSYRDLTLGSILNEMPTFLRSLQEEYVDADAVGIDQAQDEVIRLLGMEGNDKSTRAVVLYGQSGIGKTTLASAVFKGLHLKGYRVCRVDIDWQCSQHDLQGLQQQILRDLFKKDIEVKSCEEGQAEISNAFINAATTRVFIFMDNVLTESDLAKLLLEDLSFFPAESRLLITTTNLDATNILLPPAIQRHKHKVSPLPEAAAKNLLYTKALGSADENFEPTVKINQLMEICCGIPLALIMVASHLRQHGNHVSTCKRMLTFITESPKEDPEIRNVVVDLIVDFTYGRLEESYKEAFLDIAFFFNNWKRLTVATIFADIHFNVLQESGLIKVSSQGELNIHDAVRSRGRRLSQNTRITNGRSLKAALLERQMLQKIKGIWLSDYGHEPDVRAEELDFMFKSLRVFYLGSSTKVKGECTREFEELRFCYVSDNQRLPMDLNKLKRVSFFHGTLNNHDVNSAELPQSVRLLELGGSSELVKLPDWIGFLSSLQELDLSKCFNMTELPGSICQLRSLYHLKLRGCSQLTALPESFGDLSSLEVLDLTDCLKLVELPDSFGQLKSLCHLHLRGCSELSELYESFGNLISLEDMDFTGCDKLASLPTSFGQLKSLCHLQFTGCSKFGALPESFGNLSSLEEVDFTDCKNLVSLPASFGQLKSLYRLHFRGCSELIELPDSFGNLYSVGELDFTDCNKLESLPQCFGQLKSLCHLQFRGCSELTELPDSFGNLSSLTELDFTNCDKLVSLPTSFGQLKSLCHLRLKGCLNLTTLPENFAFLSCLEKLDLTGCHSLQSLPASFGQLKLLRGLELVRCLKLAELPSGFDNLSSLEEIDLTDCEQLFNLPAGFENLRSLRFLKLRRCSNLASFSASNAVPSSLEALDVRDCSSLKYPPKSPGDISNLKVMLMDGCSELHELPSDLAGHKSLKYLSIAGCSELKLISSAFQQLNSLEEVNVSRCSKVEAEAMDRLVEMERLMLVDIRESPMLIERWNKIKHSHALLVLCSSEEDMYQHTISAALVPPIYRYAFVTNTGMLHYVTPELPNKPGFLPVEGRNGELLYVTPDVQPGETLPEMPLISPNSTGEKLALLLTMRELYSIWDSSASEFLEQKSKEVASEGFKIMYVKVGSGRESEESLQQSILLLPESTVAWIALNTKTHQLLGKALMGWWKLRHPEKFPSLKRLPTSIVTADLLGNGEGKPVIVLRSVEDERQKIVDFDDEERKKRARVTKNKEKMLKGIRKLRIAN